MLDGRNDLVVETASRPTGLLATIDLSPTMLDVVIFCVSFPLSWSGIIFCCDPVLSTYPCGWPSSFSKVSIALRFFFLLWDRVLVQQKETTVVT